MFASVYREMRKVGMPDPRRVDEMEIWEIADALGVGSEAGAPGRGDPHAHLRARVEARMAGLPEPTFNDGLAPDDAGAAELMAMLGTGGSFA